MYSWRAVHTFIGTAGNEDLALDVQLPSEDGAVVVLNGLPKPYPALRVGVVVRNDGGQGVASGVCDPLGRCKVHVSLAEVNAVGRQVGSTVRGKAVI